MIWSRPGLAVRDRSLVTVRAAGRARPDRGAEGPPRAARSNLGITQDELVEVMMQTAVYAGVPAANAALRTAAEVFGS